MMQESYLPPFLNNENYIDNLTDTDNGLFLSNVYIPEEVLLQILSYVHPKILLRYTLVCSKWNRLIKSYSLWSIIYKRKCKSKPKKLPWYLFYCYLSTNYFDRNLLKNGNGQNRFSDWKITEEGGNKFAIEDPPVGADPLNLDVAEFNNKTSCFATSFGNCKKAQSIKFGQNNLLAYILSNYKPHIYLSEWTAGRFDCGSLYRLQCGFLGLSSDYYEKPATGHKVTQWEGSKWNKMEIVVTEYPEGIDGITFEHEGRDTQFWAGHYGSKMAGGVVKLLFNSIEAIPVDKFGRKQPKRFNKMQFLSNGEDLGEHFDTFMEDIEPIRRPICRLPPLVRNYRN